jgi:hypothetical protein
MKSKHTDLAITLLPVRDLTERYAKDREPIIRAAIKERELLFVLTGGVRDTMRWQVWSAIKAIVGISLILFIAIWTVGQVAAFASWVQDVQSTEVVLPVPFSNGARLAIGHLVPTSTVIAAASRLPAFGGNDAFAIAAIAAVLVALERLVAAFFAWRRVRVLKSAHRDLRGELRELRSWLSS